jgi:hypothetical protein
MVTIAVVTEAAAAAAKSRVTPLVMGASVVEVVDESASAVRLRGDDDVRPVVLYLRVQFFYNG